jgi:hypothetical protein
MEPADKSSFVNYVFNFEEDNKTKIFNMLQYTLLAIIPVQLILKATKYIFPEDDESKGSIEILAESVGQILLIMLCIWFTNRIINFIPTYTGQDYTPFNEVSMIIPFLILLSTMQTKLGAKINILMNRVMALWNGTTAGTSLGQAAAYPPEKVQIYQPLVEQELKHGQQQRQQRHQNSQADNLDTNQLLPSNKQLTAMPKQQNVDFNQMYQGAGGQANGYQGNGMQNEPMAANEVFGGMFGKSDW